MESREYSRVDQVIFKQLKLQKTHKEMMQFAREQSREILEDIEVCEEREREMREKHEGMMQRVRFHPIERFGVAGLEAKDMFVCVYVCVLFVGAPKGSGNIIKHFLKNSSFCKIYQQSPPTSNHLIVCPSLPPLCFYLFHP